MLIFVERGKIGESKEKHLRAENRTNNKLNPRLALSQRTESWPHWLEASAITTVPSLRPCSAIYW